MVYFIAGDSYSDLSALRQAGIIDAHIVIHGGGVTPPAQFPKDCANAGLSPILNNGNDGVPGWSGSPDYYKNVAALGYMGAGGESEQANEIDAIMNELVYVDYGGEGTGGGTNDDVWFATHPAPAHGFGAAGYYETYDSAANFWGWNIVGSGMLDAQKHGVKEIGIMIGSWMMQVYLAKRGINHLDYILKTSSVQDYINLANDMEQNGIRCAGFGVWSGYGNNMNDVYNKFSGWYQQLMSIWPPTNVTMKDRFAAPATTPITMVGSPAACSNGVSIKGSDGALWYSADKGLTWESLGGQVEAATDVACATSGDFYVIGTNGNLYWRDLTGNWVSRGQRLQ
jgi:hypothetical protein